ncbi:TPA: hypothetical protein KEY88_003443 [Serratia marcescens]|nr:hypothetical protein [Serratia marcescens]
MKKLTITIGKESVAFETSNENFINNAGGLFSSISAAAMHALNDENFKATVNGISIVVSDEDNEDNKDDKNKNDGKDKRFESNLDDAIWL